MGLEYDQDAARPEATMMLPDGYDCSAGHTFIFRIGEPGQPAIHEKTTGITGGAGFATIAWVADEFADVPPGLHTVKLYVTTGTLPRVYETTIEIGASIAAPAP
jgi:hypothetical protein